MNNSLKELMNTVVENDYCIGCGICASLDSSPLIMKLNEDGKYVPRVYDTVSLDDSNDYLKICPFSEKNNVENEIGRRSFSAHKKIKFDDYSGYHLKTYAGYVETGEYREKGSSGGMGNWIAAKLLEEKMVDGIIHVRSTNNEESKLFSYQVSSSTEDLLEGSKSKYCPIEMSEVIEFVKNNEGRYALVGIPCYIKGIKLLENQNEVLKERILYHIGLVCGHLKSDMFAKSIGWQLGMKPDDLKGIDFRKKLANNPANKYGVQVIGTEKELVAPTKELYTTNWGHGFFKYNACEFCDDVLAETADVTVGDAWLPKYAKDSMGTNIIVIRHPGILKIFEKYKNEINVENIESKDVYKSQAGGFRHRREGLSYRLYLKDTSGEWRPQKRVKPSDAHKPKRKIIYKKRMELSHKSFKAFKKAEEKDNFKVFVNYMDPYLKEYKKVSSISFSKRAMRKILEEIKLLFKK